ncbi:MAG: chain length determinant protein tyrosine kinase EpsG [Methylomicrobium sp.]|nr:chain length determinant protein tyrosine kinase EpsG [Methylomicrobium sp.]
MSPQIPSIGSLLLDAGKIRAVDAESILRLQKEQGLLFGDAAKTLGLITEEDIRHALSRQFDFPFLADADSGLSAELVAAYQPFSEQVEMLRAIRSQLMLRWFVSGHKTLAITSQGEGEGRSYLAANLAIVFSQLGEKTLLVDADLRRPRQHELFNVEQRLGLSDVLAGRVAESSAIVKAPVFRDLSILVAGTLAPNPLELISRGMDACLKRMAAHYDVILLDTPPGTQGADAQLLSAKAGGFLLLARQHKTQLNRMKHIKNLFEASGSVCVGAVISDF